MPTPRNLQPLSSRTLPPLILHPFADASGPDKLVESSRASLMLQGLLPSGERSTEELDRALIDGRYCEIRMLFYVGKDLVRWIEQCMEHLSHNPDSRTRASSIRVSPPTWSATLPQPYKPNCASGE